MSFSGLDFDVDVHPLLDERLHFARGGIRDADVQAVQVAADAREVELVGTRTGPQRLRSFRARGRAPKAAVRDILTLVLARDPPSFHARLSPPRRKLPAAPAAARLARHAHTDRSRAWAADWPVELITHSFSTLRSIAAHQREFLRIARPGYVDRRHPRILVLASHLLAAPALPAACCCCWSPAARRRHRRNPRSPSLVICVSTMVLSLASFWPWRSWPRPSYRGCDCARIRYRSPPARSSALHRPHRVLPVPGGRGERRPSWAICM